MQKKSRFTCDYILVNDKKITNKNTLNIKSDYNEIFIKDSKIINDTVYYVPISKSGFNFEKISINDIVTSENKGINTKKFILGTDNMGEIYLADYFRHKGIFSGKFIAVFMSLIIGVSLGLMWLLSRSARSIHFMVNKRYLVYPNSSVGNCNKCCFR